MSFLRPVLAGMLAGLITLVGLGTSTAEAQYILTIIDTDVYDGDTFALPIEGDWEDDVSGFQLSIAFTPNPPIENMAIDVNNSLVGELNPDFISVDIDTANGELIYAVLFEAAPPFTGMITLPPVGFPLLLAEITGAIPAETSPQSVDFAFVDGLGSPPIDNIFVVEYASVPADIVTDGSLSISHEPPAPVEPTFIRGDVNGDGFVDLGDIIFHLNYTFSGGPTPDCLDAGDANDDGHSDVSDGVFLLDFLFLNGPSPWPPFPSPGVDATPDSIGCGESV